MIGHSIWGFARKKSAERQGGPILGGWLLEKEKHHVLRGHPMKRMSAAVVVPGAGNLQMTFVRVELSSH